MAHVRHLQEARSFGDILIVGVTRDACVNKGVGRPVIPENERLEMVRSLRCVTHAELVDTSVEALRFWNGWKPDVFVKGSDYVEKGLLPAELEYCAVHRIEILFTKPNPETTGSIIQRAKQCAS